jgi:hypothetical protein
MGRVDRLTALAAKVSAARLARGWSKEQAAREASISAITWKRVEDGLAVQDAKLQRVLVALGLNDRGDPVADDPSFVSAPGERAHAGASNDDVLAAIQDMADAIREMNATNRQLVEELSRGGPERGSST